MTNGVLMFALNGQAYDSDRNKIIIDYVKMAVANAKNIKQYMKNNAVALITDQQGKQQITPEHTLYFDHIIVITQNTKV
jgi:Na+-transporting NADH:ubiquinone oxidoreductase subunit NqrC